MISKEYSIFYAPHADDETLTFGPAISLELERGSEVAVVLMTDSSASGVYDTLNGQLPCHWHECIHNPVSEGYMHAPVSRKQFSAARVCEFKEACLAMGVKPQNIFCFDNPDGALNVESAMDIIKSFAGKYPNATHHTITYAEGLEKHKDHRACGLALLSLQTAGTVKKARYYVLRHYWGNMPDCTSAYEFTWITRDEQSGAGILDAAEVYSLWNPSEGKYAAGYHSVDESFESLKADIRSVYHL